MKSKFVGISLCMALIMMMPVVAGTLTHQDAQPSPVGWTTIQGFISGLTEINNGAYLEFKCVFVHYAGQSLDERTTGFRYGGQLMVIPGSFRGVLLPHLIIGWCPGVLEF
jgi:hypothetical protein